MYNIENIYHTYVINSSQVITPTKKYTSRLTLKLLDNDYCNKKDIEELFMKAKKKFKEKKKKKREENNESLLEHFIEFNGIDMTGRLGYVFQ